MSACERKHELLQAADVLYARGLARSAAWAADCALHIAQPDPGGGWAATSHWLDSTSDPDEHASLVCARAHLEKGEWWRAANYVQRCTSHAGLFLRDYARFLGGERRALEALHEQAGPSAMAIPGPNAPVSAELDGLAEELSSRCDTDPFAAFLLHSVRSKQGRRNDAMSLLKQSLRMFPCNWDAWEELASSFTTAMPESVFPVGSGSMASVATWTSSGITGMQRDEEDDEDSDDDEAKYQTSKVEQSADQRMGGDVEINGIPDTYGSGTASADANGSKPDDVEDAEDDGLPNHWLKRWYKARKAVIEGHNDTLDRLRLILEQEAPGMPQVRAWLGQALFDAKELDHAERVYEQLLDEDPYRTEGVDTYSNVLYVKGKLAALSLLAHRVSQANKYTPEACVVTGNYFSSRGEHQRAAEQFKRAVRLNPRFASAWTLAGHELIEMRSPAAAVATYRRAVELSPKDYRAWYGIGQTYELLGLPLHALHYFRQAAKMRPQDSRMWTAVAQCLEQPDVNCTAAAAAAYRQALKRSADVLGKLAALHAARGEKQLAAEYHERNLERLDESDDGNEQPSEEMINAMVFLARHASEMGDITRAEHLCHRLQDAPGPVKQEAKSLLNELNKRKRSMHPTS